MPTKILYAEKKSLFLKKIIIKYNPTIKIVFFLIFFSLNLATRERIKLLFCMIFAHTQLGLADLLFSINLFYTLLTIIFVPPRNFNYYRSCYIFYKKNYLVFVLFLRLKSEPSHNFIDEEPIDNVHFQTLNSASNFKM